MAKQNVIILPQDQVLVVKGRKKLGTPEATAIVAHLRAQIAIRKGVRPSKYAHRKILNGPIPDAGKLFELGQHLVDRNRDIDGDELLCHRLSHRENR